MDNRRQQFVAIDVWCMFSNTTKRLMEDFGPVGPLAWLALLAAAKRAHVQGTVSCLNDRDFWAQLGIPYETAPPMDDFLGLLGNLKQTSRSGQKGSRGAVLDAFPTRSGRVLNVHISHFEEWQKIPKRFTEAERMRRKRAQNTANTKPTHSEHQSDDRATERRGEDTSTRTYGITPRETKAAGGSTVGSATALRNGGETPQAFVQEEGWELDPGPLAAAIMARFPELDDLEIVNLVKLGDTIGRERSLA